MGTFAKAFEDWQSRAPKDDDGKEHDDQCGGTQHFNHLFGSKLAALVSQVESQGICYSSSQSC